MMRPLLGLNMMVKDEAANIRATLESVKPFVEFWTVLDTGSTDDTRAIVREVMGDLPGMLYEEPFVDYATTRNRVGDLAGDTTVFQLSLSADEIFTADASFREYLESQRDAALGAYCVQMRDATKSWPYTRILRAGGGWKYVGDPHEIPEGPNKERSGPVVPGCSITFLASDRERKLKRLREYDLPRLEKRVFDNADVADQDQLAQAIWTLGQTHELLADEHKPRVPGGPWMQHKLTAMSLYLRRVELGQDPMYSAYAWVVALRLAYELGIYAAHEVLHRLDAIVQMSPTMPEARYLRAAVMSRVDQRKALVMAEEAAKVARAANAAQLAGELYLPVDLRMEWLSLRIAAAMAFELKSAERARQLAERALAAGAPREAVVEFLGS